MLKTTEDKTEYLSKSSCLDGLSRPKTSGLPRHSKNILSMQNKLPINLILIG